MKKYFFLFCILTFFSATASIEYEIFEYSIKDIRMRKTVCSIHQQNTTQDTIDQDEYIQTVPEHISLEQKSIPEIVQKKEDQIEKHDKVSEKKQEDAAPLKPLLAKKKSITHSSHYAQKEFDILSLEPVITKKHENYLHSNNTNSTIIVSIQNNITQEMITYNHWSGSYTPDFSLIVNETEITKTMDLDIPVNQPLKIQYKALFPYGYSSTDYINYTPNKTTKKIVIEFNWHKNPRIIITEIPKS